jgi:DNA topoisomerase-3
VPVLAAVAKHLPHLAAAVGAANVARRSKAWNDTKVTAHHAIVPTASAADPSPEFGAAQRASYELVARRYVAQFFGPHEWVETQVELDVAGERLEARGRRTTAVGWKALYPQGADAGGRDGEPSREDGQEDDARETEGPLPELAQGTRVTVERATVLDKRTSPPKPFTDASLIAAMCGVAKFVSDPKVKKILTEADGIGTPATRAGIIETLFERSYVERVGRTIVPTETGRALIGSLPVVATTPDMTAVWEAAMRAVAEGKQSSGAFLERVRAQLDGLVAQGRALGRLAVPGAASATPRPPNPPKTRPHSNPNRRKKAAS